MTLIEEKDDATAAVRERTGRRPVAVHPLRAETVRTFAPWAGAAVLLTTAVTMAESADRWQGGWAETRSMLHTALLILLPLASAAGCWQGGRERRRGTRELWKTAARGPLVRFLVASLPLALWVVAGYLVAAAAALLATWPYAGGGSPWLDLLPVDAVTLAAAAMTGQVVGRLTAWRPTAPLLAMAWYVVLVLSTDGERGWDRFVNPVFPVDDTVVPDGVQPVAMAVWVAGLAAAAVLAYAARRRYTALLPLAAAAAAGALLLQSGSGLWHTAPVAEHQVCDTSTTPQICVNARYAGLLPQVTKALRGITGRLEGVQNLPLRFEDRPGASRRDEVELPMLTPIGWSVVRGRLTDSQQYAWEAAAALQSSSRCERLELHRDRYARLNQAEDAVTRYLAPLPSDGRFDAIDARGDKAERAELRRRQAARARLASMTADERRTWLSAYFAAVRTCDPSGVPAL
ncbi:hypothetical protein [Streptomyces sp. YIM S03343]